MALTKQQTQTFSKDTPSTDVFLSVIKTIETMAGYSIEGQRGSKKLRNEIKIKISITVVD